MSSIQTLTAELEALEKEIATLKARAAARKESVAQTLRKENAAAKEQHKLLIEAAHALAMDSLRPTDEGSARIILDHVKQEVVAYCTHSKVDQELWKKLAS